MALLGGAAGFGVASKASAQQPSTLSNMPYASTPLSGAELTYVVQNGVSKKTPVSSIAVAGASPGGSSGQLQYNDAGTFGGYGIGSGLSVVGGNLTAVAGGGGLTTVDSLAALGALATSVGIAYLNLGGQSGPFAWTSGNFVTQVANDPGQGIYVPIPTDNITVTSAGTPNFSGIYTPTGSTFGGKPTYTAGAGKFIWFFTGAGGYWIISAVVGTNTFDFVLASTAATPPSGTYAGQLGATGSATLAAIQPGTSGAWIRAEYTEGKPVYWSWWGVVADGARTAATGTISLPTNPTNGQVITFNGGSTTTVTAVTSGATGNQFNIGGSAAASFTNLMALLEKSTDSNISQARFTSASGSTSATVTYFIPGTTGNSFAMTTNITGGSVSATLSGGTTTGTDNTQAIINWSIWANYVFTTIGGHTVIAPPGEIHWNVSSGTAVAAFFNLGKFNWIANNVKFVNISASQVQPGPAFQAQTYSSGSTYPSDFIATTAIGDTGVTLLTPANAANYPIGSRIRLASLFTLSYGYPDDPANFEWHTVINQDPNTGWLGFDDQVRFVHRQDFPDNYPYESPTQAPCGRARVWPGAAVHNNVLGQAVPIHFDTVDVYIEGIEFVPQPNMPIGTLIGNNDYTSYGGIRIETKNVTGGGISESLIEHSIHNGYRSTPFFRILPDKVIGDSIWKDPQVTGEWAAQSMTQNLQIDGGFVQTMFTGSANAKFTGTKFGFLGLGFAQNLGLAPSVIVENCKISENTYSTISGSQLYTAMTSLTIDGTNVSFGAASFTANNGASYVLAGGVFKFLISPGISGVVGFAIGTSFCLSVGVTGATSVFPGDQGVGHVVGLFQDATYIYVVTNRQDLTALPSWAGNMAFFFNLARLKWPGSSGSDIPRMGATADENGARDFEYYEFDITQILGTTTNLSETVYLSGEVYEVGCTVYGPGPSGNGSRINPSIVAANGASSYALYASSGLVLNINAEIAGTRILNTTGITGAQSGDTFQLGGSTITSIPAQTFLGSGTIFCGGSAGFIGSAKLWYKTRCGVVRTIPTHNNLFSTQGNALP